MDCNLGYQISRCYEAENGDRSYFLISIFFSFLFLLFLFLFLFFPFSFSQLAVAPDSNFPRFATLQCYRTVRTE